MTIRSRLHWRQAATPVERYHQSVVMAATDPDLSRILHLAEKVVPGLQGRQAVMLQRDGEQSSDREIMRRLYQHWVQSYPEAGAYYAALRSWVMMIWQPVYLSVIASHLGTHVPRLSGLRQVIVKGATQAFVIPAHAPEPGTLMERVGIACEELDRFCRSVRKTIRQVAVLHDRAMNCLQAECVLGALLRVRSHIPHLSEQDMAHFGLVWLDRLQIPGSCSYFSYMACPGRKVLELDRKVCCHHFRRNDGVKCATCPKLSMAARIKRLLEENA